MFRPVSVFIGLRYTRAKRRNHFISFISLMSMIGIALGVLVLIIVLSVMNGFDREIKNRVFSMVPQVTVSSLAGSLQEWHKAQDQVDKFPGVVASAPYVAGQVLLTSTGVVQPAMVNGIMPEQEIKITDIGKFIVAGDLTALQPKGFGIILGEELADHLGVALGDKVTMVTPQLSMSPAGVIPRFKRFNVVGVFHAGSGFGFDSNLAFINLGDAQKLFQLGNGVSGLHVKIKNIYAAPALSHQMAEQFPPMIQINNWSETFGAFFHAVSLEKTMMSLILMLIVAIAVFNLVCTLVMVVNEKEADIAILRTFGATPGMVMAIFVVQGAVIGVIGTFLGVASGVLLAPHVTSIVNGIQTLFHVNFVSSGVYFVDYLPSELQWPDVIHIGVATLALSLIATIYPAWRAARTQPVEALRYE